MSTATSDPNEMHLKKHLSSAHSPSLNPSVFTCTIVYTLRTFNAHAIPAGAIRTELQRRTRSECCSSGGYAALPNTARAVHCGAAYASTASAVRVVAEAEYMAVDDLPAGQRVGWRERRQPHVSISSRDVGKTTAIFTHQRIHINAQFYHRSAPRAGILKRLPI